MIIKIKWIMKGILYKKMIIRAKAVSQDIKLSRTVGPRGPQEKPVC